MPRSESRSTLTSTFLTCTARRRREAPRSSTSLTSRSSALGLPTKLGDKPISARAEDAMFATPIAAAGLIVGLTGFYWVVKRRQKMAEKSWSGSQGVRGEGDVSWHA